MSYEQRKGQSFSASKTGQKLQNSEQRFAVNRKQQYKAIANCSGLITCWTALSHLPYNNIQAKCLITAPDKYTCKDWRVLQGKEIEPWVCQAAVKEIRGEMRNDFLIKYTALFYAYVQRDAIQTLSPVTGAVKMHWLMGFTCKLLLQHECTSG